MMTILIATYVGNLVAAMVTEKLVLPFKTLKEFADQNEYIPGYAKGGLAELLLKVSKHFPETQTISVIDTMDLYQNHHSSKYFTQATFDV